VLPILDRLGTDAGAFSNFGLGEPEQLAGGAQLKSGNLNRQHGDKRRPAI
jgi:hypothetical protein